MHKINEKAAAVLDRLAAFVPTAGDRHVLHSKGYMDLHLYRGHSGLLAVAHYFEQNGDLMSDPRMTFWRGPDGRWYPVDYELHSLGIRREAILEWTPNDHPARFAPRIQRELARFAAIWCSNILEQEFLEAAPAAEVS